MFSRRKKSKLKREKLCIIFLKKILCQAQVFYYSPIAIWPNTHFFLKNCYHLGDFLHFPWEIHETKAKYPNETWLQTQGPWKYRDHSKECLQHEGSWVIFRQMHFVLDCVTWKTQSSDFSGVWRRLWAIQLFLIEVLEATYPVEDELLSLIIELLLFLHTEFLPWTSLPQGCCRIMASKDEASNRGHFWEGIF